VYPKNEEEIRDSHVPGHGGDVWWVRHEDSGNVGAYGCDEMEPLEASESWSALTEVAFVLMGHHRTDHADFPGVEIPGCNEPARRRPETRDPDAHAARDLIAVHAFLSAAFCFS
jgi:hypothetical protein